MYTNNRDERKFLYVKKYFAGKVVDEEAGTFDTYYGFSDEYLELKQKLEESTLLELLIELVHIFKIGWPNSSRLASLFGKNYDYAQGGLIALVGLKKAHEMKEEFEKQHGKGKAGMDHGDKIIGKVEPVERQNNDIQKVEIDIDMECLKINDLYLYDNEIPNMDEMKATIEQYYDDIKITIGDRFIISDESYRVIVVKEG